MESKITPILALAVLGIFLLGILPGCGLFMNAGAGTWIMTSQSDFKPGEEIFTDVTTREGSVQLMKELDLEWTASGNNKANSQFGFSVANAGDVNNDGYDDVIVGAPFEESGGAGGRTKAPGAAYLYLGTHWGLQEWPAWTSYGSNQDLQHFGVSVAGAGDVNGDGYDDVIVGSPHYDSSKVDVGKAYLYLGSPSGLLKSPSWTSIGKNYANDWYGYSVAGAGDVNADGYDDWIVSSVLYDSGTQPNNGIVFVYLGSPSVSGTSESWVHIGDYQANKAYGASVCGAGDVNGDGFDDWIISANQYDSPNSNAGKAYLYLGSSIITSYSTPAWTSTGDDLAGAQYGFSVSGAGDVNGDGFDDWIVGAYQQDTSKTKAGKAFLYTGSSDGLSDVPAWTSSGDDQANAWYGGSVSGAGDVNGDGYDDWVVGAPRFDASHKDAGKVYLYAGSAYGLNYTPVWTSIAEDQGNAYLGHSVSGAGDVNNDGHHEVIVGANMYNTVKTDAGQAYVFMNHETVAYSTQIWQSRGDKQLSANYGQSIACAGDVNADGYDDWLVGAHLYDTSDNGAGKAYLYLGSESGISKTPAWTETGTTENYLYGKAVAGAGDVNGDGYDDWLVGAPNAHPFKKFGKAFLYLGGKIVSGTTAAWSSKGDDQNFANFGHDVAGVGDVNGDGYDDWLVSAHNYDVSSSTKDAGKLYLYLGSSSVSSASPAWTYEGYFKDTYMGCSISGAGDVNGDGYSDFIAGAYGDSTADIGAGSAHLFLGSYIVSNIYSKWDDDGEGLGSAFGYSVSGAGDVNGDGYDDWIVAAPYHAGFNNRGRVYVYLGGPDVLSGQAAWIKTGDQKHAKFGYSVSGAGDVNGDGYNDWLVGTDGYSTANYHPGKAFLYLGTKDIEGREASWVSSGQNKAFVYYGKTVAGGGDINGDGLDDWFIGAPGFDSNRGKVYMYRARGYCQYGEYISPALDGEKEIATIWQSIGWNLIDRPEGTQLKFQVATNDDGNTWDFVGPDGTSNSFYTNPLSQDILKDHKGRYLRYKGIFTAEERSLTPLLKKITVHYGERMTAVKVISPNGDEDFLKGINYPITWTASGILGNTPITLYYSLDNGDNWTLIASNEANDGIYNWSVPAVNTSDAVIRIDVTDVYGYTATDTSDLSFSITPHPSLGGGIISLSPESIWGLGTQSVAWSCDPFYLGEKPIAIYLTTDGISWMELANGLRNTGLHDIEIPAGLRSTENAQVKILVENMFGDTSEYTSPKFTIDTSPPVIIHTPPESLETDNPQTFTATVYDNFDADDPVLYYRTSEAQDYQKVPMLYSNGQFQAGLSIENPDEDLYYYIQASDGANIVESEQYRISTQAEGKTSDLSWIEDINSEQMASLGLIILIIILLTSLILNAFIVPKRSRKEEGRKKRGESEGIRRKGHRVLMVERRNRLLAMQRQRLQRSKHKILNSKH
jgi:hypothetical protein